jgi:hypothetical protein
VKRAAALGTGDLNPHWFHKPAFLMYLLFLCDGAYFAAGFVLGMFGSVDEFGAHFLSNIGSFVLIGRVLVCLFGMGTVWFVYRIGKEAGGTVHGIVSAGLAAVLLPMVAGSQVVKADVPAGFFVTVSFYCFLRYRASFKLRTLILASLLAGAAMGTKYYGVLLLPGYFLVAFADRFVRRLPWRTVLVNLVLIGVIFTAGFFVTSPYNFIDPTFSTGMVKSLKIKIGLVDAEPRFDPDNKVEYDPGPSSIFAATVFFFHKLTHPRAFGMMLSILAGLGLVACLLDRRTRPFGVYAGLAALGFVFFASGWNKFHINWRHFNAIYPVLCTLVLPGAIGLGKALRVPQRQTLKLGVLIVCIPMATNLRATLEWDRAAWNSDTRTVAYRWIVDNLDGDDLILLDDYGPILQPNREAVRRQQQRLRQLPQGEAFTAAQGKRLDLLERFPDEAAKNLEELGHPWWMKREPRPGELQSEWGHRDHGNPLTARLPRELARYCDEGFRYVITNSRARGRYATDGAKRNFPSFSRFYRELARLEPLETFEPDPARGKGPTIWVYDIRSALCEDG